jgi:hypothetical protein
MEGGKTRGEEREREEREEEEEWISLENKPSHSFSGVVTGVGC